MLMEHLPALCHTIYRRMDYSLVLHFLRNTLSSFTIGYLRFLDRRLIYGYYCTWVPMMGSLCSRLMNNYKTDRREGKPPHAIAMGGWRWPKQSQKRFIETRLLRLWLAMTNHGASKRDEVSLLSSSSPSQKEGELGGMRLMQSIIH